MAKKIDKVFRIDKSTTFTLDAGFSDLKVLGKGSYGIVVSAYFEQLGKKVAVKKVTPVAKQSTDAKHVLREVRLLRHMGKHENIISLYDLRYREQSDELYMIMELMDSDLHQVIQSKQSLTENHFQHFMYQLLCGLKYLHDHRIIHRDLKPGNILLTKDCRLRITDFGLSRERPKGSGEDPEEQVEQAMTQHVVTRWYRPPELMLCPDGMYNYAVDLWSVGCIFAEMFNRNPLFPGKNFIHQLILVFDVIGSPQPAEIRHIVNPEAKKFLSAQTAKLKVSFSSLFPAASSQACQLLDRLLIFDPDRRMKVDEALSSRYFSNSHLQAPLSMNFPAVDPSFEFAFERENLSRLQLKQLIANEVSSFRRDSWREEKARIRVRNDNGDSSSVVTGASSRAASNPRSQQAAAAVVVENGINRPPRPHQQSQQQQPQQQSAQARGLNGRRHSFTESAAKALSAVEGRRKLQDMNDTEDDDNNDNGSITNGSTATASTRDNNVNGRDDKQQQRSGGSYMKNTTASTARSNSTSKLRPSYSTSSSNKNNRRNSETGQDDRVRAMLKQVMQPDAYDSLIAAVTRDNDNNDSNVPLSPSKQRLKEDHVMSAIPSGISYHSPDRTRSSILADQHQQATVDKNNTNGSGGRKSLMETYTSPKRFSANAANSNTYSNSSSNQHDDDYQFTEKSPSSPLLNMIDRRKYDDHHMNDSKSIGSGEKHAKMKSERQRKVEAAEEDDMVMLTARSEKSSGQKTSGQQRQRAFSPPPQPRLTHNEVNRKTSAAAIGESKVNDGEEESSTTGSGRKITRHNSNGSDRNLITTANANTSNKTTKKITVPKSPKFSTMNWQKRNQQQRQEIEELIEQERKGSYGLSGNTRKGTERGRSVSTGRVAAMNRGNLF